MRTIIALAAAFAASLALPAGAEPAGDPQPPSVMPMTPFVLDHEMKRIDGTAERLDKYKGKVVLIVNTASRCGLTPQYEALEKVYREYKDRGLVVLGFPANNFMGQEPGTNKQIAAFCTERFEVTFPMFEKISVKGEDAHPLYRQLAGQPDPAGGEPSWNFTKYLVDREGNAVMRFDPRMKPTSEKMIAQIEALLKAEG
jgi:glutathione peroxidase